MKVRKLPLYVRALWEYTVNADFRSYVNDVQSLFSFIHIDQDPDLTADELAGLIFDYQCNVSALAAANMIWRERTI